MSRDHAFAARCSTLGLDWEHLAGATVLCLHHDGTGAGHLRHDCPGVCGEVSMRYHTLAEALVRDRCAQCAADPAALAALATLPGTTVGLTVTQAELARLRRARIEALLAALVDPSALEDPFEALSALRTELAAAAELAADTTPWAAFGPVFRQLLQLAAAARAELVLLLEAPVWRALLARHAVARIVCTGQSPLGACSAPWLAELLADWTAGRPLAAAGAAAGRWLDLLAATQPMELVHLGRITRYRQRPTGVLALFDPDGSELRWLPSPLAELVAAAADRAGRECTRHRAPAAIASTVASALLAGGLAPPAALGAAVASTA